MRRWHVETQTAGRWHRLMGSEGHPEYARGMLDGMRVLPGPAVRTVREDGTIDGEIPVRSGTVQVGTRTLCATCGAERPRAAGGGV